MKNFILNAFEDFITGNGIWILVGCLAFALIVSVVFLYLNIQKEKKEAEKNKQALIEKLAEQYSKKELEKKEEVKEAAPKKVAPARKANAKKAEPKTKETVKSKAPAKKTTKKVAPKVQDAIDADVDTESGDYDISYDAESKEWVIKRTNLARATKRTSADHPAGIVASAFSASHCNRFPPMPYWTAQ